jgi:hypothetical protein
LELKNHLASDKPNRRSPVKVGTGLGAASQDDGKACLPVQIRRS